MEDNILHQLNLKLRHFQTILQYLDISGNLKLVKAQCEKYRKVKVIVYTFKLLIDFPDLCEADAELGNLLIQQPVEATNTFQEVIYKLVLVLDLLPGETTLSQVAVILRLSSLPRLGELNVVRSVTCLSRVYNTETFCVLVGTVTGLSAISKYTQSTQYFCPDEDCIGHAGNHYIRVHTAGASEAQTVRRDFKCRFCCSLLFEEKSNRTLSDKRIAEVVPVETMSSVHRQWCHKARVQAVPVYVRDDLTKTVEIGETYEIIGTVRKDIHDDRVTLMIETVDDFCKRVGSRSGQTKHKETGVCQEAAAENSERSPQTLQRATFLCKINNTGLQWIEEAAADRNSSPWSFVLTMAYRFGGDVCSPGSYFTLKLAMLLSLMSQLDRKVKPIHLLAIGSDTEIVSRLMLFGQRFLERSGSLTVGQPIGGHVTMDKYNSAEFFVEGGMLHICQDGVCYIGNINRLKKPKVDCLQSALTSQKIATDVGSKFTGGLPQHLEQPLKSRVWGYSDPAASRRGPSSGTDEVFGVCNTGDLSKTLLEAFSLLCFTDCGDCFMTEETEAQIAEQTLVAAMMPEEASSNLPVTASDFYQYMKFASKLRPVFTKEAESLVHSYYLTCRKSRSTGDVNVPLSADQTILSLAYSHAKLALNTEVTTADAVMAIKIYEDSLTVRFGLSVLSVQPIPHITQHIVSQCLGPKNDHQMLQFHANLKRYCSLARDTEE